MLTSGKRGPRADLGKWLKSSFCSFPSELSLFHQPATCIYVGLALGDLCYLAEISKIFLSTIIFMFFKIFFSLRRVKVNELVTF